MFYFSCIDIIEMSIQENYEKEIEPLQKKEKEIEPPPRKGKDR